MRRHAPMTACLVVLCAAAVPVLAGEAPELKLKPCTIELVDGTEVAGKLAVQFDMPDHLIVYSPRLATVRSFLKDHVHALTVDGTRRQLNAKRELTDEDKTLLGQTDWPDAPPAKGVKPAYTTESWDKPLQLMVWAHPGRSGKVKDPGNWLVNGQPLTRWPRAVGHFFGTNFFKPDTTDLLFPAADERYGVRAASDRFHVRHLTVEHGGDIDMALNVCTGNIWIGPNGAYNGGGGANLGGAKHTFFINGRPHDGTLPETPEQFDVLMDAAPYFARKWVVRKATPEASITLIGGFKSGDETHWMRGVTILEEDSVISVGPRCVQTVGLDAKLIMKSGSVLGKNSGNQAYKNDMRILGDLLAGTPDEPITRSVYLGISIKDSHGRLATTRLGRQHYRFANVRGLTVAPGGRMRVHTADPDKARLHVTWHGVRSTTYGDDGTPKDYFEKLPEAERTINVNIFGEQKLENVVFDWVGKGDIRLLDPDVRQTWRNIGFGTHNKAAGDALFAKFEADEDAQEQIARWRKQAAQRGTEREIAVTAGGVIDNRYFRILPSGGTFAAGEEVAVRLDWLGDPEGKVRYSTDGSETGEGQGTVYDGPITITETTTIKAGCIQYPGPHFRRQWREYEDTFTFVAETRRPDEPTEIEPGVLVEVYDDTPLEREPERLGKPLAVEALDSLTPALSKGRGKAGLIYSGYVQVPASGVWRFYTETAGPSRLYIGERLVVNNHRRHRDDEKAEKRKYLQPELESWGSLKLAAGKHAFRLECWYPEDELFNVCYEGPGVTKRPIPADALYRPRRWNAVITPGGGLHEGGETVAVRLGVDTRADASGVTIRYTLDGSEPTGESAAYDKPIAVEKDTTVRARCFRDGEPVPGKPGMAKFIFLSGLDDAKPGLVYRVYDGGWNELPEFDELDPADSGTAERIGMDVTDRGSNFGLVFNGYLAVPTAGEYTFYTTSDDGSALYIDGKKVVDNDGAHGMQARSGTVTVSEGPHLIRVEFFQGIGGKGLEVHWKGPGGEKQPIPSDVLSH
ncbi:MAG: chitobiase/beta-hexosaminidase C-terminal domain-containing protein [Phycisphaerae bacterium]|nr:chitobiase/beta-hexosaminidase C-terminal domain-containing protein [Phycisphaerae bacterium]